MLQFFLKRKRFFFLLVLFIVSLSLFARDVEKRKQYNIFDRLFLELFSPPLKFSTRLINRSLMLWDKYFFLVNLKKENSLLKESLRKLEIENMLQRESALENRRLRKLLSFKKKFSYKILPAEIIGRDPSSWFKTILVDKGITSGIFRGAGIITPRGIVGKIINVSGNTAKALLITDVNSSVDALVKRTRARGIVEGNSENSCKLSYVLKTEDIKTGDVIISSGLHGIYPKGVLIGKVSGVVKNRPGFFLFIQVKPSVDFSKLNEVLIVLKKKQP